MKSIKPGDTIAYKNVLMTVKESGPFNVLCTYFQGDQLMQIKLSKRQVLKVELKKTKVPYLHIIEGGKK